MPSQFGWNISVMTGHSDPVVGGIAYDALRQRLWITEQGYGTLRFNVLTTEYEMYCGALEPPAGYGPIAVANDGSVFVGVNETRQILRFDADLNPLAGITFDPVIGIAAAEGTVALLSHAGGSLTATCMNEAGMRRWSTQVARGESDRFFSGHTPVFRTRDGIAVIVASRISELVLFSMDGVLLERRPFPVETGSWNSPLDGSGGPDAGVPGRRYLLDATYNAKHNSLMLLYAPPASRFGLVVIDLPLDWSRPAIYNLPLWITRILWAGSRLACYGGETFTGNKKIYPIALRDLERVPLDEFPALNMSGNPSDVSVLDRLFSGMPRPAY
ncbi:MAG: hypothetical protein ACLQVD_13540 [Capsulimonadaceae bacterium]